MKAVDLWVMIRIFLIYKFEENFQSFCIKSRFRKIDERIKNELILKKKKQIASAIEKLKELPVPKILCRYEEFVLNKKKINFNVLGGLKDFEAIGFFSEIFQDENNMQNLLPFETDLLFTTRVRGRVELLSNQNRIMSLSADGESLEYFGEGQNFMCFLSSLSKRGILTDVKEFTDADLTVLFVEKQKSCI